MDPTKYSFHVPPLKGCLNDAAAMRDLAAQRGYTPTVLTESQATAGNVTEALTSAVRRLQPGMTMMVTYAGHGSQVVDTNRDDGEDRLDETWVLHDRQLIDDEIAAIFAGAPSGARILIVSDSCHSGTVARALFESPVPYQVPVMPGAVLAYGDVMKAAVEGAAKHDLAYPSSSLMTLPANLKEKVVAAGAEALEDQWAQASGLDTDRRPRKLDPILAQRDLVERKDTYGPYLSLAAGDRSTKASILLMSACEDHQTALDGAQNGLFTQELLGVVRAGGFNSYPAFIQEVARRVNLDNHRPRMFWASNQDPAFEGSAPFAP